MPFIDIMYPFSFILEYETLVENKVKSINK